MTHGRIGCWAMQVPGWLLLIYLIYAQGIPAFNYDIGVAMGTQEPAEHVTEVGVAFWWGFAFADLVVYIPLLGAGLIGHLMNKDWARLALAAALGITVYWPVVCLATVVAAHDAAGWNLTNEGAFWVVLPPITLWAIWGLWHITAK